MTTTVYGTSAVRTARTRRTNMEIAAVDAAIITAVATETPVTVRGVFYRVVSGGAVEKTEKGYGAVQRRLLHLRRTGLVPYSAITDGTRLRLKPDFVPGADVVFERISVTPEQIDLFNLETRPTKRSDSRAAKFVGESVEVDAIPASVLRSIVRDAIEQHLDPRQLALTKRVEAEERDGLEALAGRWLS